MAGSHISILTHSGLYARAVRVVILCATLLMLAGAAHAAAHDHEQGPDLDSECIICAVAAANVAKTVPDAPSISEPEFSFDQIRWHENRQVVGELNSVSRYPRGPPLLHVHSN